MAKKIAQKTAKSKKKSKIKSKSIPKKKALVKKSSSHKSKKRKTALKAAVKRTRAKKSVIRGSKVFAVAVKLDSDVTSIYKYPDKDSAVAFYNEVTSQGLKATITEAIIKKV